MNNLIACGTKVVPKLVNIESIITCVSIRFAKVTYELSYFYNGEYKTIWVHESEFTVENPDKFKIGFK